MSKENVLSLLRSGLKIVGAILLASGIGSTGELEAIQTAIMNIAGTGMTLAGLFWSLWDHTPDGQPAPLQLIAVRDPAARDNVLSLVRSGLKIVGALCLTIGIGSAGQIDAIAAGILDIAGTGMTLAGLFWSLWHHTPDGGQPVTLRRFADTSPIPADVAAKMAANPSPA